MNSSIACLLRQSSRVITPLAPPLQDLALLALRLWLAWVFFKSGLTKIEDWDSTLFLFHEEYAVLDRAGRVQLPRADHDGLRDDALRDIEHGHDDIECI